MKKISVEEYKGFLVKMLEEIDEICNDNGLSYSLAFGSLLGAIRHNGFIPWDDDLDIVMLRNDYDRLRELINSNSINLRFIDSSTTDTIYPFGKVCDQRTFMEEKNFKNVDGYGAFIDVFPLDNLPDNAFVRLIYCRIAKALMIILTHSSRTAFEKSYSKKTNLLRLLAFLFGKLFNPYSLCRFTDSYNSLLKSNKCNFVGVPWFNGFAYPPIYFSNTETHMFENKLFKISKFYDDILRNTYGDYMIPPPQEEQIPKHQLFCYYK